MTVANLHSLASNSSPCELLKIVVKGAARRCEKSVNTHVVGMLSGPVALLSFPILSTTYVYVTLITNSARRTEVSVRREETTVVAHANIQ